MPVLDNSLLSDIQEVNLSYLLLAQRLLRENLAVGMYRLGFDEDVAETVLNLSPAQIIKLSASNTLLCAFRLNDYELLSTLTQNVLGGVLQQAHSTILLSQRATAAAEDTI
ncbi:flagellar transcriptional regulator FlhD [Paenalcaligenes faecalis]|uniref:flagellar transcriptional regulator FlhD n=1 Tax=Paenalcaligenes faecalis TaxID=2980099 RepID=UPI0022B97146|nr:flagellar transcriptional regulator FlhD [Paenalcaligenes faecalis]